MKKNIDLINSPIDSSLRRFSLPLAVSFLIHMLYAWVDMYYVSKLGIDAMAAVGVGEQLLFFAFGIGIGFGVGSGIIIARRIGESNLISAGHTATQAIVFMMIFATIIAIVLYFFMPIILSFLSISDEVNKLATTYLTAIIVGLPFNFLIFQTNSIIRSTGNSFIPMIILISANVLNAILSPLFIFGIGPFPEWGVFGAGFATALAQFGGAAFAIIVLIKKFDMIKISFKDYSIDYKIILKIFRLGIPASLQLIAISLNRIILTWMVSFYGTVILTTYMLGLRVDLLVFMTIFAVGAAIEIITGQNLGAGKIERIHKYHKSAIKQISVLMIFLGVVVFFGGKYFAIFFTEEAAIISNMMTYLRITSFSYVFFAYGLISIRVISGAGDYFRSLRLVIIVLYLFQLPMAYLLSSETELAQEGIWYAILVSQIFFAIIGYYSLKQKKWIKVKV